MFNNAAKPAAKHKGGRPPKYRPEFVQVAERLCGRLGATDEDVSIVLGVSASCVEKWKTAHPEFGAALKSGKAIADERVEQSLYRRALGYSHKAVKILTVSLGENRGSEVEQVPYIERYPPDTTACIFWLKNRRPAEWRERQAVELSASESLAGLIAAAFPATSKSP